MPGTAEGAAKARAHLKTPGGEKSTQERACRCGCGRPFVAVAHQQYFNRTCQIRAFRRRHPPVPTGRPRGRPRKAATAPPVKIERSKCTA